MKTSELLERVEELLRARPGTWMSSREIYEEIFPANSPRPTLYKTKLAGKMKASGRFVRTGNSTMTKWGLATDSTLSYRNPLTVNNPRALLAEIDRLRAALVDIQNVGARHSDEMVAVGFCVMRAKMALEPNHV